MEGRSVLFSGSAKEMYAFMSGILYVVSKSNKKDNSEVWRIIIKRESTSKIHNVKIYYTIKVHQADLNSVLDITISPRMPDGTRIFRSDMELKPIVVASNKFNFNCADSIYKFTEFVDSLLKENTPKAYFSYSSGDWSALNIFNVSIDSAEQIG